MTPMPPRYSFVLPVYEEEALLPELFDRLASVLGQLDGEAEVVLVDDGSRDRTLELLRAQAARDPRFRVLALSRNFGHQAAITAGIDHASGDAVVVMDSDLQDPPEVALDLAKRWQEGYEVVYAVREDRQGDPLVKRLLARLYYRTLRKLTAVDIPPDVGDFRLVDRRALDEFRALREHNRYVRGMFSWIGFRQTGVPFTRDARHSGTPKYSTRRSLRLGIDGVISFSNVPLRLALSLGFFFAVTAFVLGTFAIIGKVTGIYEAVPGAAWILVGVAFLGGVQLIVIGMMGLYVARIYDEVRRRPLYIVSESHGFDERAS